MIILKISKLNINNFRLFKNQIFFLGKYITVFSGTNAVGKSTLLGILGNSSELKTKDGRPILQKQFRTEFSEIFKMSQDFDKTKSNILTIYFDDGDYRICRITWQKHSKSDSKTGVKQTKLRPRIIPEYIDKESKKRHSQKKNWPTLFLGLSRFYPLGESDTQDLKRKKYIDKFPDLTENRNRAYKKILSLPNDIKETSTISIDETSRKQVVGITTSNYDYLTNSAGQDNLGQILLAVDSFRILKKSRDNKYNGGLLLIDEIDATLHPSAQNRLFDYLFRSAKALDLQIVCTTHSLSLLSYVSKKISYNTDTEESNPIELYYMSIANNTNDVRTLRNPKYEIMRSLLLENPILQDTHKAAILSEDEEARWFIKNIIKGTKLENHFNFLPMKLGKNSIISLIEGDPIYASTKIIVFDGDLPQDHSTSHTIEKLKSNEIYTILVLPGGMSPEQTLNHFLTTPSEWADKYFEQDICFCQGITRSLFQNEDLTDPTVVSRETYKEWFQKYQNTFNATELFHFYAQQYEDELNKFRNQLEAAYHKISKKVLLPEL